MDGAKPGTEEMDAQNKIVHGKEACCVGRSSLLRGGGPRSNEDPAGSSSKVE